jgi:superfamily II DNA or RNA helicase
MRQELREYQKDGLARVLAAYAAGARSVLMVLPTGGGKTSVFCHLASETSARVLILVHRRELATQAANRLREFGVDFGFVMSGEHPKPAARVQIASVQTLVRRAAPRATLVIADEAHLSTAATWSQILEQYPNAKILGVTATPWRLGGKPLIGAYDASVVVSTPAKLREAGFLSPYCGFSYLAPDLSGVEKVGDDYNQQQTGAAMGAPAIVTNIVEQWQAHARELSTVVFAVTVEHSQKLTAEFRAAGVRAEHLDGGTPVEQRKAILARVERGVTQVLCNVGVAVEGLDIPRLKCCVLARPTMSLARAIQMMGRVRRPWNGVTARIHDHAFVIKAHGLPDQERDYSLTAKNVDPPPLRQCKQCLATYDPKETEDGSCPVCAYKAPVEIAERTGPEMIDDAEQFDFSSDDAPAAAPEPPVVLPPVAVEWTKPGRVIEGIFQGSTEEKTPFGMRLRFMVQGAKRAYSLPGNAELAQKMRVIKTGERVRVEFTGERELPGGKTMKTFRLQRGVAE